MILRLKYSIPSENQKNKGFLNPSFPGFKNKIINKNYLMINKNSNGKIKLFMLICQKSKYWQNFFFQRVQNVWCWTVTTRSTAELLGSTASMQSAMKDCSVAATAQGKQMDKDTWSEAKEIMRAAYKISHTVLCDNSTKYTLTDLLWNYIGKNKQKTTNISNSV